MPYQINKNIILLSIFFFFLSVLILSIGINNAFVTAGEPREALVAQSMFIEQDFLQSVRYGNDIATKPPFFHWCIYFVSKLTGEVTQATSRIPSALFASITLVVWFLCVYANLGKKAAILTFFILTTTAEWYRHATLARIDMTLAMFITFSNILLYKWVKGKDRYLYLSLIPLSLGTLTKGPVGAIIPLGTVFCFLLYIKKLTFKKFFQLSFIGFLSLILWAIWLFAQYEGEGRNLTDTVVSENILRFFDSMSKGDDPHAKNAFYFFCAYLACFTPWNAFFVGLLLTKLKEIKNFFKNFKKNIFFSDDKNLFISWCVITILFCICFFMVPESKRTAYLIPCFPQTACLLALFFIKMEDEKPKIAKYITTTFAILFSICFIIVIVLKYNLIDVSFFDNYKHLKSTYFYILLFRSKHLGLLLALVYLLPLIFAYLVVSKFKDKKNYFLRFAFIFIVFFLLAKGLIINTACRKLSADGFIKKAVIHSKADTFFMLSERMYPIVFSIRKLNKNFKVYNFNEKLGEKDNLFLWKSDENLLPDIRDFKIKTSKKNLLKRGRFLEFAKRKN